MLYAWDIKLERGHTALTQEKTVLKMEKGTIDQVRSCFPDRMRWPGIYSHRRPASPGMAKESRLSIKR